MQLSLDEKVVVVTGSSSGIGLQIAKEFIQEGAQVIVNGRDEQKAFDVARDIGAKGVFVGDLTAQSTCDDFLGYVFEKFGRLDHLVCNVGSGTSVPVGQETTDEWERVLKINLFSTTQMVNAALKLLIDSKGTIVCISSICGVAALGCPIAYAGSKAALQSYMKNQSKYLGQFGVRINSVVPGNILFENSVWEKKLATSKDEVQKMLDSQVALSRLGRPEDVAALAVFLSSERASFITGGEFVVDGGQIQ